jgi:hypothetical protein
VLAGERARLLIQKSLENRFIETPTLGASSFIWNPRSEVQTPFAFIEKGIRRKTVTKAGETNVLYPLSNGPTNMEPAGRR